MASALIKQRDYKYFAEKYSELNEFQVKVGKKLLELLGVKRGDKVLDMGCGTGEITSFIADKVGEEGEVLGVDPDQERIKVAVQKHCGAKRNIKFIVGDSSSHFPHYNEEYYDVHFSNYVLQWLTGEEKNVFFSVASNCLKPEGTIVILSADNCHDVLSKVPQLLPDDEIERNVPPEHCIEKSVVESMLEKFGFEFLVSEYANDDVVFQNLETFLAWCCASDYIDDSKIVPYKKEAFAHMFVKEDGTVYFQAVLYQIIAKKYS